MRNGLRVNHGLHVISKRLTTGEISRFSAKFTAQGEDDCWIWQGAKTPAGYGKIKLESRFSYAHHVALELSGRPRLDGLLALHSCDNPSCVNPKHLDWGTQRQNMRQAISRGRAPHKGRVPGEKNGNAKLRTEEVIQIRSMNGTAADLAATFGVSRALIHAVKTRRAWSHIQ